MARVTREISGAASRGDENVEDRDTVETLSGIMIMTEFQWTCARYTRRLRYCIGFSVVQNCPIFTLIYPEPGDILGDIHREKRPNILVQQQLSLEIY